MLQNHFLHAYGELRSSQKNQYPPMFVWAFFGLQKPAQVFTEAHEQRLFNIVREEWTEVPVVQISRRSKIAMKRGA